MKKRIILTIAIALFPMIAAAQQVCSDPYFIDQPFAAGTRWKLCWQVQTGPNLIITGAWFQTAPNAPWIKLIYDARVSQLFVPYHLGSPRYLDMTYGGTGFGFYPVSAEDCPASAGGTVIGPNAEVCKQFRDRGLAWRHDAELRRGEELVLWSVLAAENYNYIIEWTFRDDGVVMGRVGATGYVAGPDTHVHGPIWRLDLDLNGACCDTVQQFSHKESGFTGIDSFNTISKEGGLLWDPMKFTSLHLSDGTLVNGNMHKSKWHLMATRDGTPLHDEDFSKYAFWVTLYHWGETLGNWLPIYVENTETVADRDVVLWYYGGLHHLVRDEDSDMTHLMWIGFTLKPHDVFDKTPMYP